MMDKEHITKDLMNKLSDDVVAVIRRVLSIAPDPHLPIVATAGAACMGFVAAQLEYMSDEGRVPGAAPDPECVLLAGLLCARLGIGGPDPIGAAYADLKVLTDAALAKAAPVEGKGRGE